MDEPWVDSKDMRPDLEVMTNLVEAMARYMAEVGCCDDCVAKVRDVRRDVERLGS